MINRNVIFHKKKFEIFSSIPCEPVSNKGLSCCSTVQICMKNNLFYRGFVKFFTEMDFMKKYRNQCFFQVGREMVADKVISTIDSSFHDFRHSDNRFWKRNIVSRLFNIQTKSCLHAWLLKNHGKVVEHMELSFW
jgi:hypothetical protein